MEKIWIAQRGSGLDKRQCTLQIMTSAKGEQTQIFFFLYTFFGDTFCILSGYVRPSRQCWEKTRCLMTANGSENDVITSEGLPSYQVPSCTGVESG